MSDSAGEQLLFTYGTLQDAEVQLDTFGRVLASSRDTLPGYTIDYAEIPDHRAAAVAGPSVHPVLRRTGDARDKVVGRILHLTAAELDAADEYECPQYRRSQATLGSGRTAWVYGA